MDAGLDLLSAASGAEALKLFADNTISVIVTDNKMPGMPGTELLSRVRTISPDTVRILMTAHADLDTAIEAINMGEVYRFIVKPWDNDRFVKTVLEAGDRFEVVRSLKRADEATLRSLAQTIELKDPYTRGHCDRVAAYALLIAPALSVGEEMMLLIKHGSWLHDCGKIGVPEAILNKHGRLSDSEIVIMKKHPIWGAEVGNQAMLHPKILNIIRFHHERYDGSGYPTGIAGDAIPLEARIVAVADVFDALTTDRPYREGLSREQAWEVMRSMKGKELDPDLVDIFMMEFEKKRKRAAATATTADR
jgi:putative two-component system response regulator